MVDDADVCGDCSTLVRRVTEWHARHGGKERPYDLAALLGPHLGLEALAEFNGNIEGLSTLHRCRNCRTCWAVHEWLCVNDVNIERASDACVQHVLTQRENGARCVWPPDNQPLQRTGLRGIFGFVRRLWAGR
jgi:hypothetical protein